MSPSRTSTRWCPTPEQVMILEELYRRGLKTPKAAQIQRITAHLSFFGKIQGKNVFYWFQNHKARDRQKLRKRIAKQQQLRLLQPHQLLDDPQTRFLPPPFHPQHHLSHIHYSAQYLLPQGAAISEDNSIATTADHFLMMRRINGHDSAMIMGVGPTYPPCFREEDKQPLQTLELFPLRSSSTS